MNVSDVDVSCTNTATDCLSVHPLILRPVLQISAFPVRLYIFFFFFFLDGTHYKENVDLLSVFNVLSATKVISV